MREEWTYKRLKDVLSFVSDGDWIESRHQSEAGIRLIQTGNVGDGFFKAKDDKPHFISEHTFSELSCTEVCAGDCLVSRLPEPVGRACLIPDIGCRMITAVDCTILRFEPSLLPAFFVYYSRSKQYHREIENNTTGTTRKRISRKNLELIKVPLPPLDEQERIVAELDLLSGIIEKLKVQLNELDNLAQSVFYDMFGTTLNEKGWSIKTYGEIGSFQRGGGFLKSDYVDDGFPCLHYGQIHTKLGIATYHHLTCIPETLARRKSKLASTGDVIIAITSEDVEGSCKCTAWMGDYPIAVGGHAAIFKHSLNPIYAAYSFKSDYFQKAKAKYAHGFKVVEIKPSDIASISVCIPPTTLQNKFAESISIIELQKGRIIQSITETQKLFDYTMDKYFG